jgi:hypothetical protein
VGSRLKSHDKAKCLGNVLVNCYGWLCQAVKALIMKMISAQSPTMCAGETQTSVSGLENPPISASPKISVCNPFLLCLPCETSIWPSYTAG